MQEVWVWKSVWSETTAPPWYTRHGAKGQEGHELEHLQSSKKWSYQWLQGRFLPSVEEGVAEDTHRVVQAWTWENGEQVLNSEDEAIETNPVLAALRKGDWGNQLGFSTGGSTVSLWWKPHPAGAHQGFPLFFWNHWPLIIPTQCQCLSDATQTCLLHTSHGCSTHSFPLPFQVTKILYTCYLFGIDMVLKRESASEMKNCFSLHIELIPSAFAEFD